MPECHRLRGLHMGEAGHDRFGVLLRLSQQCELQGEKTAICARTSLAHPEPQIGGHLIIAGSGRVQSASPISSASRASTFMWMSSNSRRNGKEPASISLLIAVRPLAMESASLLVIIPCAGSMAACACEPVRSCGAKRLSKSMEVLISSMMAAGPRVKRPPHILFAVMI